MENSSRAPRKTKEKNVRCKASRSFSLKLLVVSFVFLHCALEMRQVTLVKEAHCYLFDSFFVVDASFVHSFSSFCFSLALSLSVCGVLIVQLYTHTQRRNATNILNVATTTTTTSISSVVAENISPISSYLAGCLAA